MGIPREVAHMRTSNNPLFHSDNKAGPGDYDPKIDLTAKKGPVVGFGKVAAKNLKTTQNQWEEKMEQYVGVKPGENRPVEKVNQMGPMISFEMQMRNKQSFMF